MSRDRDRRGDRFRNVAREPRQVTQKMAGRCLDTLGRHPTMPAPDRNALVFIANAWADARTVMKADVDKAAEILGRFSARG